MIDKEEIIKLFDEHNIKYELVKDEYGFWRTINFFVLDKYYKIIWYCNLGTFVSADFLIKFTDITINGYWPNNFKKNINFIHNDDIIGVLPIENY